MAFKPGKDAWCAIDNVAGTLTNLTPYFDNVSWPQTVQQVEVSVFGTASKAFVPGLTDGDTITLSGPLDVTLHSHLGNIKAAQAAGSSTSTINWAPLGSVASLPKISAECYLASYQVQAGVGGRAEFSASLQVTGAVTNTTW